MTSHETWQRCHPPGRQVSGGCLEAAVTAAWRLLRKHFELALRKRTAHIIQCCTSSVYVHVHLNARIFYELITELSHMWETMYKDRFTYMFFLFTIAKKVCTNILYCVLTSRTGKYLVRGATHTHTVHVYLDQSLKLPVTLYPASVTECACS